MDRVAHQPHAGDRRRPGDRRGGARRGRAGRSGQHLRHAARPAPARVGRRYRRALGDEIPFWPFGRRPGGRRDIPGGLARGPPRGADRVRRRGGALRGVAPAAGDAHARLEDGAHLGQRRRAGRAARRAPPRGGGVPSVASLPRPARARRAPHGLLRRRRDRAPGRRRRRGGGPREAYEDLVAGHVPRRGGVLLRAPAPLPLGGPDGSRGPSAHELGIEDVEDLWRDLDAALRAVHA